MFDHVDMGTTDVDDETGFTVEDGSGKLTYTYLIHNDSKTDDLLLYDWKVILSGENLLAVQDFDRGVEIVGNYRLPLAIAASYASPSELVIESYPELLAYRNEIDQFNEELENLVIIDTESLKQALLMN